MLVVAEDLVGGTAVEDGPGGDAPGDPHHLVPVDGPAAPPPLALQALPHRRLNGLGDALAGQARELTDEPELVMVAELIREAALEGVRDELPHSLAVVVDEIVPREGRAEDNQLLDVRVNLYVERPSQKAIIIGKGGSRLREVGTNARKGIEALLGTRIYLDLHVKVAKDWQRDPKQLRKLGF